MARSGSNRDVLPDFAVRDNDQQQNHSSDAITHLKFNGVDAAVANPRVVPREFTLSGRLRVRARAGNSNRAAGVPH